MARFGIADILKSMQPNGAGKATEDQVQAIIDRHGVNHVVIGHTVVDQVGPLDSQGVILGIDVKWKDRNKAQGLLMKDGELYRAMMDGQIERLR